MPAARDHAGVFLSVEEQVRRDGGERGETAASPGGGESTAETHRGGAGGGHPGVEGGGRKKVVSPQLRREAVLVMQVEVELSQRRACGLMELYRATYGIGGGDARTRACASGCASWQRCGADSATGVCRSCWGAKGGK